MKIKIFGRLRRALALWIYPNLKNEVETLRFNLQESNERFDFLSEKYEEILQKSKSNEALACRNQLTGLHNDLYLKDKLKALFARKDRGGDEEFGIMFMDMDHLKKINDECGGHAAGDLAISDVASVLAKEARTYDEVIHKHGDEFVIIVVDIKSREDLEILAKRYCEAAREIEVAECEVDVSISVGAFFVSKDLECSSDEALKIADAALYYVKATGKDGWCVISSREESDQIKKKTSELKQGKS